MNTPKTFEEWRTEWAMRFGSMTNHEAVIASTAWTAAQAAVANPWHEWAKEKPTVNDRLIVMEYQAEGCVRNHVIANTGDLDSEFWGGLQVIAWQYITPSPFSAPVKSEAEAEKAWYEHRENLEHAITHAAFCEVFNLVLEKGKDKP